MDVLSFEIQNFRFFWILGLSFSVHTLKLFNENSHYFKRLILLIRTCVDIKCLIILLKKPRETKSDLWYFLIPPSVKLCLYKSSKKATTSTRKKYNKQFLIYFPRDNAFAAAHTSYSIYLLKRKMYDDFIFDALRKIFLLHSCVTY